MHSFCRCLTPLSFSGAYVVLQTAKEAAQAIQLLRRDKSWGATAMSYADYLRNKGSNIASSSSNATRPVPASISVVDTDGASNSKALQNFTAHLEERKATRVKKARSNNKEQAGTDIQAQADNGVTSQQQQGDQLSSDLQPEQSDLIADNPPSSIAAEDGSVVSPSAGSKTDGALKSEQRPTPPQQPKLSSSQLVLQRPALRPVWHGNQRD